MRRRQMIMDDFGRVSEISPTVLSVDLGNGHTFKVNIETLAVKVDADHGYRLKDAFAVMDALERASKLEPKT